MLSLKTLQLIKINMVSHDPQRTESTRVRPAFAGRQAQQMFHKITAAG